MGRHLRTLLEGIVVESVCAHFRTATLDRGLKNANCCSTGTTRVLNTSRDLCAHQLFEAQVERTPGCVAVALKTALNYRELNARANKLAHHLRGLGVGAGDVVGIFMERSLETIVGVLGILKAGAACLPLDPSYPRERLAFM
jgi:non-ribosomal peptide synthetase component F